MFNQSLFKSSLKTRWVGRDFEFFPEIESTNSYAKILSKNAYSHGMVILADQQISGRGQYSRSWKTESGQNLTFSIIFLPEKAESLPLLTLACSLAACECIQQDHDLKCDIKWPNDILINGKKICGILTETQFIGNKLEKVIVGIGLNVNQVKFSEEIQQASSLAKISGNNISREKLLANILSQIEQNYQLWTHQKTVLVKRLNRHLIGCGEMVKLQVNGEELEEDFKFLGVSEAGTLLALNSNLELKKFTHEQVRVLLN